MTHVSIIRLTFLFLRFIYVRYAPGLIKDSARLLHLLVTIFTVIYGGRRVAMAVIRITDYTHIPVGKFCTRQDISTDLETNFVDYSLKYKIGISFSSSLFVLALSFFYISAMKSR